NWTLLPSLPPPPPRTADAVTDILDNLLLSYDKSMRPHHSDADGIDGPPHGPDLRQGHDLLHGLLFPPAVGATPTELQPEQQRLCSFQLNEKFLHEIWRPDTHFLNGHASYLHNITSPNVLIRITSAGEILYSMRLTIKVSGSKKLVKKCALPMDFHRYPMDTQHCPLHIGSHGYGRRGPDLQLALRQALHRDRRNLMMSQFDLVKVSTSGARRPVARLGNFSVLSVSFVLKRHVGYFLIQLYLPAHCLWCCPGSPSNHQATIRSLTIRVSFWLNREATADRVALGITTVLTMAFLFMDSRADLPRVSYSTAIDWYVAICFTFVLSTLLQFAAVHYFTKGYPGTGELYGAGRRRTAGASANKWLAAAAGANAQVCKNFPHRVFAAKLNSSGRPISNPLRQADLQQPASFAVGPIRHEPPPSTPESRQATDDAEPTVAQRRRRRCLRDLAGCLQGSVAYKAAFSASRQAEGGHNSVSAIDRVSRVGFPGRLRAGQRLVLGLLPPSMLPRRPTLRRSPYSVHRVIEETTNGLDYDTEKMSLAEYIELRRQMRLPRRQQRQSRLPVAVWRLAAASANEPLLMPRGRQPAAAAAGGVDRAGLGEHPRRPAAAAASRRGRPPRRRPFAAVRLIQQPEFQQRLDDFLANCGGGGHGGKGGFYEIYTGSTLPAGHSHRAETVLDLIFGGEQALHAVQSVGHGSNLGLLDHNDGPDQEENVDGIGDNNGQAEEAGAEKIAGLKKSEMASFTEQQHQSEQEAAGKVDPVPFGGGDALLHNWQAAGQQVAPGGQVGAQNGRLRDRSGQLKLGLDRLVVRIVVRLAGHLRMGREDGELFSFIYITDDGQPAVQTVNSSPGCTAKQHVVQALWNGFSLLVNELPGRSQVTPSLSSQAAAPEG
uniref:Neur_chan_LBD domain-containing protein n=1 Tax=Macrostomum lignano TaxID=282301 RepID=A0A1I8FIA2_9PLAT